MAILNFGLEPPRGWAPANLAKFRLAGAKNGRKWPKKLNFQKKNRFFQSDSRERDLRADTGFWP